MILADAHIHLFEFGFPRSGYDERAADRELGDYEDLRTAFEIDEALVVGYEGASFGTGNNAYIRRIASTRPWISTVAFVDAVPLSPDRLVRLLEAGHVGLALYLETAAAAAAVSAWPRETWAILERDHSIVSLNATPVAHPEVAMLARRHPTVRFVWSHLGLPGAQTTVGVLEHLLSTAALGNCWVKLSGLYAIDADPPHPAAATIATTVVQAFGADRVMWGSDFSPALSVISFADAVAALDLVYTDARAAVGRGVLRRLLNR